MQARIREEENRKTVFKYPGRKFLAWIVPLFIIASYIFLASRPDLRTAIPVLIGITAFVVAVLAFISYIENRTVVVFWSPAVIIAVAVFIRLLFLFRPPELSDDIYRYVWDGLQTLEAHNPYAAAPSGITVQSEIDKRLLAHINHPNLVTIYPPAAEISFAAGAYFGGSVRGIKALLFAADIATCLLLIRLLSYLNLPSWRSVLYAWHPLPVIEISSSGHVDGVGTFFLLLAILFMLKGSAAGAPDPEQRRITPFSKSVLTPALAGISFAFSALVKLFPFVFLPGFIMLLKRRMRTVFVLGLIFGSAALIFPFLPDISNLSGTLNLYLRNWEFSGFLFRLLRKLTSSGSTARVILFSLFLCITVFLYLNLWSKRFHVYRRDNTGDFLRAIRTLYFVTIAFLLLTTTLYPWYALTLVALFPFTAGAGGMVLSWTIFLSYRVLISYTYSGRWIEDNVTPALIFLAPVAAFLLAASARKLKALKSFT